MFQNKVMFADKLQNPFLKPSPFVASPYLPSYTSTYTTPPLPSTYKYNTYKTYEQPPALNYKNKSFDTPSSYNVRGSEVKDIDTMLINSPFNRKSSNFGGSRTFDLSPNKYSNQATSYNKPKVNSSYQNYQYLPPSYENISVQSKSYRDAQRLTPTKKYDNYLSTSSADSAATYINRITDFEEDKASVYQSKPLPENPFYRKNLMHRTTQLQKIPTKDYEPSVGLKYMSYKTEVQREVPPVKIDQNSYPTYVEDDYQNMAYKYNYQTTFSKDKNQTFEEQRSAKFGSKQDVYGQYKYSFQRGDIPVYDYQTYESKQNNSKYNKYEYKPQTYDTYKASNSQPLDKIQNYAYDSIKLNQKYSKNAQDEKMSYNICRDQPRFGSIKDSFKNEKTYEEPRVRFDEDQEAQSSKFKSYKGIDINLENLGANPYAAYTAQSKTKIQQPSNYSYEKNYTQTYKLASSQVDEYTGHQQMQKKIKQNKYQKLGLEKQMQKYTKKVSPPSLKVEMQDSNYLKQLKSGAPIRDSQQYPKVLEYKGVLFHKIEVM